MPVSLVVQLLSHVWLFVTLWTAAHQASLSFTNSQTLLKLMSIESVMPSNNLIFCFPLLFLPLIVPSIKVHCNESYLHIRWAKYWSFSFSISPSNEYSGLISFRIDWFDLLAVQGTLKSLLQHHSSKASILRHSGNGNPLQCSCLENPRDGEAWWAAVYEVAQSRTRLKRLSSSNSSILYEESLMAQTVKNLPANAGDLGLIPQMRWSTREANGYPIQYSCLENSMDRGAWWAPVHEVAKSQTRLSD